MADDYFALPEPRRSWLMHCTGADGELDVCEIAVNNGAVAIYPSRFGAGFELEASCIAEFRAAFDDAVAVAADDMRARAR